MRCQFRALGARVSESVIELRGLLKDADVRETFSECIAIGSLLSGCVIGKHYRVSDAFVAPIKLSPLGENVVKEVLNENKRAKPNEIKLAVFLHVGCSDGLLVSSGTDIVALRHVISAEMRAGKILFPYIFGRDLHDLASEQYPEMTHLNNGQTLALLRQLPQGVFQEGRTVTGPLGAVASDCHRVIVSRTSVPGYFCSDEKCSAIHSIELESAETSSIVRSRGLVSKYVERHHGGKHDEHARLLGEATALHYDSWTRRPSEGMFDTLADALTLDELRAVADAALRSELKSAGARSRLSKRFGVIINSPREFVDDLDRASLLQVLLTFDNEAVARAIDSSVRAGDIGLEEYEVRVARLNRHGDADWEAQIGPKGVRSTAPQAVAQRLHALLRSLYNDSGLLDEDDLAYALDGLGVAAAGDLATQAVRELDPRRLLEELVFPNRRTAAAAARFLGLGEIADVSRPDLLDGMLWKLGAPAGVVFTEILRMERSESELEDAATDSASPDVVRGHISNLFSATEDVLQRALTFSTWALTQDHFLDPDGFQYNPLPNVAHLEFLETHSPTDVDALQFKQDGKNTLAPLAAGFGRLAKALSSHRADVVAERPSDQFPFMCKFESRPFAFAYSLPFLNLSEDSQSQLLDALTEVAAQFSNATVAKVRNSTVHGNNDFPTSAEITFALERVRQGRAVLSRSGIFPQIYSLALDRMDVFGRREVVYTGERKSPVSLFAPVWPVVADLPFKQPNLVIMEGASLGAAGPLRFRLKPRPGIDQYWDGWPKRWRIERAYSTSEIADSAHAQADGPLSTDAG